MGDVNIQSMKKLSLITSLNILLIELMSSVLEKEVKRHDYIMLGEKRHE